MPESELSVESLDHEARGVGRLEGKAIFVENALPGERVRYRVVKRKASYELGETTALLRQSAARVTPRCPHFGVCGGCSMQHLDAPSQVAVKQRILEDNLERIGKVTPGTLYRPIHGPAWHYRLRARLSVRHVPKRGGILVGFHERKSSWVADMSSCAILPTHVSNLLVPLRRLVGSLSIRERLPQIELAVGEGTTALVLRILEPLAPGDARALESFAKEAGVDLWLQPRGPDSAVPFAGAAPSLTYRLPAFGVALQFLPTDFTQVNHAINRVLVERAVRLLDAAPGDAVADFFCGLGNFTIPLATRARRVVGVEGSAGLVARAEANARANGVAGRARFAVQNLFAATPASLSSLGPFDKALIDPPREGALELCRALVAQGPEAPRRIVYVSCNPSTLARDAALLTHTGPYVLKGAGVINMFPHTSHVESIALFEVP